MNTVAVPVFRSRIAPVLDFSRRIFLIHLEDDREVKRTELHLKGLSPGHRVAALSKADVTTLICGGISDALYTMLKGWGIHVIWGVAGAVDKVLAAFVSDRLDDPEFHMPGRGSKDVAAPVSPEGLLIQQQSKT
jgi:predicted Fe-Mo cluster-binding NifX family protein